MAKASGMGQTKNMSFVSSDDGDMKQTKGEEAKLLNPNTPANDPNVSSQKVDFFNNRDYYKIFLETSKEQEERIKKNSPFSGLKTWKLLRVIFKTNDDLR